MVICSHCVKPSCHRRRCYRDVAVVSARHTFLRTPISIKKTRTHRTYPRLVRTGTAWFSRNITRAQKTRSKQASTAQSTHTCTHRAHLNPFEHNQLFSCRACSRVIGYELCVFVLVAGVRSAERGLHKHTNDGIVMLRPVHVRTHAKHVCGRTAKD